MLGLGCAADASGDGGSSDGGPGSGPTTQGGGGPSEGDPTDGGDASGSDTADTTDTADTADTTDTDTGDPPSACGVPPPFDDGIAPTSELHVAVDGADAPGCGAPAAPCATLEAAATGATPGTAIRIHAGSYPGDAYIAGLAGTPDAPIWIGGATGEARPVFEGGGVSMQLSAVRWLVVHDLEIRNMSDNGLNIDDGGATDDPEATRGVVLRGLSIHDIGTGGNNDCLKLSGVNDFAVLDSEFQTCGGGAAGSAIDQVGCHHGIVANNHFHDLQASGNAVQTKGGSEDVEVYANVFENAGERAVNMGGSTGFEFFRPPLDPTATNAEARDIRVVANVFVGSMSPVALVGCTGCLVANNTMVDPEHWVLRVLQETESTGEYTFAPSGDNRVVGNLVVYSRALVGTVVNIGPGTAPETFEFSHNLWYAADAPDQSDPGLPVPETGAVIGLDPGLADDRSITADSPAAGAGLEIAGLRGDHRGSCWATPPSIGAFEIP